MILTVSMSPCVDVTVKLDEFRTGRTNVAAEKRVTYAGKANNVAAGVARLGEKAFVTGFMYNENGALFEKALDKEGIPFCFVWNAGRVRENYKFIDGNGVLTEVNEEGRPVAREKLADLLNMVRAQSAKSVAAVISGGLPKGTPDSYYGDLVAAAKTSAILVAADTYGDRLLAAIDAGADIVKPNLDELSQTFGKEFTTREEQLAAARELVKRGAKYVLLSLGADGAMLVSESEAYYCKSQKVEVVSTVGAGDAMLAAATIAVANGCEPSEILRSAVSAGTAAVSEKSGSSFEKSVYDRLFAVSEAIRL